MSKQELVDAVASAAGTSKTSAAETVDAFVTAVTHAVVEGEGAQLVGFQGLAAVRSCRSSDEVRLDAASRRVCRRSARWAQSPARVSCLKNLYDLVNLDNLDAILYLRAFRS